MHTNVFPHRQDAAGRLRVPGENPAELVETDLIEAAQAVLTAAEAERDRAVTERTRADARAVAAKAELEILRTRVISGRAASDAEILSAEQAPFLADKVVAFRRRLLEEHFHPRVREAALGLSRARDLAHRPVLVRGLELRLAAAKTGDQARGVRGVVDDAAGLAAARADFENATRVWFGYVGVAARLVQNCTLSRLGHERRANVVQWTEV